MSIMRGLSAVVVALLCCWAAASSAAAAGIPPVRPCADLKGTYAIAGAVTHVTSADVIETEGKPRHCEVGGLVEPAVKSQLELPLDTFTGRYLQYGCDGYCGFFAPPELRACGGPSDGTFAVAATDDGHVAQPPGQFGVVAAVHGPDTAPLRDRRRLRAQPVRSVRRDRPVGGARQAARPPDRLEAGSARPRAAVAPRVPVPAA
jgi:hypothetical protein